MTDGYVGSVSIGSAKNLPVEKIMALAAGFGVGADELFGRLRRARGR